MARVNGYKGIAVFSSARSGTTLLTEQLSDSIQTKHPEIRVVNPGEILDPTQAYDESWQEVWTDKSGMLDRPIANAADLWRIERLINQVNNDEIFPIIKIFGNDLSPYNWSYIRDGIINDREWYVISLLRSDIANMLYSSALGWGINRWHRRNGNTTEKKIDRYEIPIAKYQDLGKAILRTLDWHLFHRDRVNATIWYDQMISGNFELTDLNISNDEFVSYLNKPGTPQKVNHNHKRDVISHVSNHEQFIEFAENLQHSCMPLIKRIRS